jgi:hypothetical protein
MTTEPPLESGIRRDLREDMTYADYLRLHLLLAAQQPLSRRSTRGAGRTGRSTSTEIGR